MGKVWKALFLICGIGIFAWGIIIPNWIRMIGGCALMFFSALIDGEN